MTSLGRVEEKTSDEAGLGGGGGAEADFNWSSWGKFRGRVRGSYSGVDGDLAESVAVDSTTADRSEYLS